MFFFAPQKDVWLAHDTNVQKNFSALNLMEKIKLEAVARRCSVKRVFLEMSQNSQEKNLCQSLFFNKLQTQGLQPYSTRDSGTGIFLWILWNFKEHLFYRTPLVAASSFIFSIKLFLLNTPWWMTDWLTWQAFMHSQVIFLPKYIPLL